MDKLLEIKDLYVHYNTDESVVHALNGFSLDVVKGEALGLVGETGAGKTTMALSTLRLLPEQVGEITGGSIHYNNLDILKASKKELRELRGAEISMIFQDPMTSLNPVMTIGDQIKEVLDLHFTSMTTGEKDTKVDDILSLVGITPERKDQYPHQFSGGMKQRVVIAMALVAEPKLLLADEPTTALDVTIQAQILALMRELKDKFDSAMILITHDLGIVAEFCDSVAVVYAGSVIEKGTVEQVFIRKENHPYTTGLFRCIPDLTSNEPRLTPIPGYMVDSSELPKGCKFADRCTKCHDKCLEAEPDMHEAEPGHFIKCYYSDEGSADK
ncbi:ABC transporter ATP-binding protein [Lachnospiraceae bacterium 54-53]